MDLREGEQVLKVYHHHPTPFVFDVLKMIGIMLPFYIGIFVFKDLLSMKWYVIAHIVLIVIFALIITYVSLIYWLDKLIITNQRVIYLDYKNLTSSNDAEAFLNDIADVKTQEKGILSYFRVLDYGLLEVSTPAAEVTFRFLNAPDPEGIRQYIYHIKNLSND